MLLFLGSKKQQSCETKKKGNCETVHLNLVDFFSFICMLSDEKFEVLNEQYYQ